VPPARILPSSYTPPSSPQTISLSLLYISTATW
jgi:hypothetical protein